MKSETNSTEHSVFAKYYLVVKEGTTFLVHLNAVLPRLEHLLPSSKRLLLLSFETTLQGPP